MIAAIGLLMMILGFGFYDLFDLDSKDRPAIMTTVKILLFGGSTVTTIGILYALYSWIF